jgi:poly-beta-1,6-N-acetyl-D-glucosamine synthase
MIAYFFIMFGIYFLLVLLLISGWQLALEKKTSGDQSQARLRTLSIIIPFRNEAVHLTQLLRSLFDQTYSAEYFEVIFVDDHSTDASASIVNSFIASQPAFKLLSLSSEEGKKKAISLGVNHAKNDIIITTDADCTMTPNWLMTINESFASEKTMMGVGPVKIVPTNSFFSQLQGMEFASLIGSGAATLSYGVPTMCNGANLSFRRKAFHEVNGYEGNFGIASGDDEFLMRKFKKEFSNGIHFIPDSDATVVTQPLHELSDFIHQRVRWAGKWRYNDSWQTKGLAAFIFIFQLSFIMLPFFMLFGLIPKNIGWILISTKVLLEFLFLYQVGIFLRLPWRWTSFFVLQFIYPVYVGWIGLVAHRKSFEWKGRRDRRQ